MSPTDPLESDDGWADLARELGLEGGSEPATPTAEPDPVDEPPAVLADDFADAADDDYESPVFGPEVDEESDDAGDDDDETEGSADESGGEEDGEPGTKKRRRRRRRRKKKGSDASGGENADETEVATVAEEPVADGDPDGPGDDEGATPEMTRELIRTWNVPSWEEIVTGLYRPQDHR